MDAPRRLNDRGSARTLAYAARTQPDLAILLDRVPVELRFPELPKDAA